MKARRFLSLLLMVAVCLFVINCGGSNNTPAPVTITSISEIGTIGTVEAQDVAAYGNYLYYADWGNTNTSFGVIDFTDPANPVVLDTLDAGSAYGVAFDGRYAYVETDGNGTGIFTNGTVGVVDCLDPNNLVEVIANDLGYQSAYDNELSGNYLYNFSSGIIGVYDVTDPPTIAHVSNIATSSVYFGRAIGNNLYVGDNGDFVIYDITSPATSIPEVGRLTIPGGGYGSAASGTTAYIAGTLALDDVIYSIDISDPANPVILSSVVTPSFAEWEMRILGNYILAVGSYDFVVIDISDPANMVLVDSIAMGNNSGWGFDISGRYAIAGDDTALRIFQLY